MTVLRVDDIPLLYAQIQGLRIQQIIDECITPHGNRTGLSLGHLMAIWLCYLLSEADHRLSSVEEWIEKNQMLLIALSGQSELTEKDFTDDRLEQALDYLSQPSNWQRINRELAAETLEVYDLDVHKTIRLDAAPMQGHQDVKVSELFEYGYSKHHNSKLGMLKIMLACVDNSLNGFGYPLAHLTVGGATADDVLYRPIVEECEQIFALNHAQCRKLYVGDSKISSIANRYYIHQSNNDYLGPLSKRQLSEKERMEQIEGTKEQDYHQVYQEDKSGKQHLIAQGFEQKVQVNYEDEQGKMHTWEERRIYVRSTAYASTQQRALNQKLEETPKLLQDLLVSKQGRTVLKTAQEVQQKVDEVLSKKGLIGLLEVKIEEQQHTKTIRAYGQKPARIERWSTFGLQIERNESVIATHKKLQGWQVYATTTSREQLDFEKVVWKYRHQNRVESRFNDLRNKVVPLVPIFLSKDNRIEALINLLMICLKVCCVLEFKVAKQLNDQNEELAGIYEGNPKRSTDRPTAKRLLKQFRDISLVIISLTEGALPQVFLTDLTNVQLKILNLLGFEPSIYKGLTEKLKLLFLETEISEI
ncbi:MAG: IS1634 family transposase [Bacteroidota bacterium]